MKRSRQIWQRLYWIDAALQSGAHPNATGLALDLGVSPHTILHDLARLRDEFRAPLTYDPGQHGFAYRHSFRPDLPRLSAEDGFALARALGRAKVVAGTALERELSRWLDELILLLPEETLRARIAGSTEAERAARVSRPAEAATPARATGAGSGRPVARRRLRGLAPPSATASSTVVRLSFDAVAGPEILRAGLLRREEVQLLTEGGFETTLATDDPDALLLELLRWAPHLEIRTPAWMRRRLATMLRQILRVVEKRTRRPRPLRGQSPTRRRR